MGTLIVAIPGSLLGAGFWIWSHAQNKKIQARKFNPTANNTYPAYLDLKNKQFIQPVNGELLFLPNLHTLHNAPRITGINGK